MKTETKRQNFNITPEQEAEIAWLRDAIDAPSTKDAILWAVRMLAALARETRKGRSIYMIDEKGEKTRLIIPEIEPPAGQTWKYLVERPHPWRRQLYVKGRKLRAFTVCMDMQLNHQSVEEAADNWDLPVEAIYEIVEYCDQNEALLAAEADEERRRLLAKGVVLEPPTSH